MGKTLTQAHEQVYGPGKGTRKSKRERASQTAALPHVKAAIAEYAAEFEARLAPIEDLRAVRQEMLANIRWLAQNSPDQRVRLAASVDLRNYADERERRDQEQRKQPLTIDSLIHEIRALEAPEPSVELETTVDRGDTEASAPEAPEAG